MPKHDKYRLASLAERNSLPFGSGYGFMRGTVIVLGDIVGPTGEEPWDCKADLHWQGIDGQTYSTESECETTNELS